MTTRKFSPSMSVHNDDPKHVADDFPRSVFIADYPPDGRCVGCHREVERLVRHHWWFDQCVYVKYICLTCNRVLKHADGMTWDQQLAVLNDYHARPPKRNWNSTTVRCWVSANVHADLMARKHKGQTVAGYIQEMLDREKEREK